MPRCFSSSFAPVAQALSGRSSWPSLAGQPRGTGPVLQGGHRALTSTDEEGGRPPWVAAVVALFRVDIRKHKFFPKKVTQRNRASSQQFPTAHCRFPPYTNERCEMAALLARATSTRRFCTLAESCFVRERWPAICTKLPQSTVRVAARTAGVVDTQLQPTLEGDVPSREFRTSALAESLQESEACRLSAHTP